MRAWSSLKDALGGTWAWGIFLLAAGIRVISWGLSDFSHDEFSALGRVDQSNSWRAFWDQAVLVDAHPAGVQAFLTGWSALGEAFGVPQWSTLWVKLPFLVVSIWGLGAMLVAVQRYFNREVAVLTLALFAGLQWPVLQSVIARPYAPGVAAVFTVAALLAAPARRTLPLGLALAACAYLHHFAALQAVLLWGAAWAWGAAENRRALGWSAGIAVLLYAPHLPVVMHQMGHGGLGEVVAAPSLAFVSSYLRLLFNDSEIMWLVMLGLALVALALGKDRDTHARAALSIALFFVPLTLAYAYSLWRAPILMDRTLFFAAPFLIIGLAGAAVSGWRRLVPMRMEVLWSIALVGSLVTLFAKRCHHEIAWKSAYQGTVDYIESAPDSQHFVNMPTFAWEVLSSQRLASFDAQLVHDVESIRRAAEDPNLDRIGLSRSANYRYLSPDADALLWCYRPLLEVVPFYNGDCRSYGAVRTKAEVPPGLRTDQTLPPGATFLISTSAGVADLLKASGHDLDATPNREVYALVQLPDSVRDGVELVLKCTLDETTVFYRSARAKSGESDWLAVGLRLADLTLSQSESERILVSAYLWNPNNDPFTSGPLILAAAPGNRFQYAWAQSIPGPDECISTAPQMHRAGQANR